LTIQPPLSSLITSINVYSISKTYALEHSTLTLFIKAKMNPLLQYSTILWLYHKMYTIIHKYCSEKCNIDVICISQVWVLYLKYTHKPKGHKPETACVYSGKAKVLGHIATYKSLFTMMALSHWKKQIAKQTRHKIQYVSYWMIQRYDKNRPRNLTAKKP